MRSKRSGCPSAGWSRKPGEIRARLRSAEFFCAPRGHEIEVEAELLAAAAACGALFEHHMLPWLDTSSDVASIERLLNASDSRPGQYTRVDTYAFSGIAAASLCGRQDLGALAARYLTEMQAANYTHTIERFDAFVRHMGIALPA